MQFAMFSTLYPHVLLANQNMHNYYGHLKFDPRGGTFGISGWGCTAGNP